MWLFIAHARTSLHRRGGARYGCAHANALQLSLATTVLSTLLGQAVPLANHCIVFVEDVS